MLGFTNETKLALGVMIQALSIRRKVAIAVTAALLLVLGIVSAPVLMELQTISRTKDQFLLESAVAKEAFRRPVNKISAGEFLSPSFLRHYNLSSDDNRDTKGHIAQNGNLWNKWGVKTKTAAILMGREDQPPSVWELSCIIHRVDEYYALNDLNTPLMEVVKAAATQR